MGRRGWNRLALGGFLIVAAAFVLAPGIVRAQSSDVLSETKDLLSHLPASAPGAEAAVVAPIVTPPLSKFTASGRVTSTLASGPCPGPVATACGSSCANIKVSGPVIMSPGGKGTVSACLTVLTIGTTTESCFDQQGNGTLTAASGSTIKFATAGHFCVSDIIPIPPATPTNELFNTDATFNVEGGTGQFVNAVGQGNLTVPFNLFLGGSPPLTSAGVLSMVGAFAKQ